VVNATAVRDLRKQAGRGGDEAASSVRATDRRRRARRRGQRMDGDGTRAMLLNVEHERPGEMRWRMGEKRSAAREELMDGGDGGAGRWGVEKRAGRLANGRWGCLWRR
jgi:hypothetical protein